MGVTAGMCPQGRPVPANSSCRAPPCPVLLDCSSGLQRRQASSGQAWPGRPAGRWAHWISQDGLVLLAAGEIGVSTTLRARCFTAAAAGACASFSTTRLPTCHPQKSSESDSSRSEWTPHSSRHNATTSRSGTGAFVFDMGPGNNGMPPGGR